MFKQPQQAPLPYDPAAVTFYDPFMGEVEGFLESTTENGSSAVAPHFYPSELGEGRYLVDEQYLVSEMGPVEEVQTSQYAELDPNLISNYENNLNKRKKNNEATSEQNKIYQVDLEPKFAPRFPGAKENKTVAIKKRRRANDKGSFGSVFSTQYCDQDVVLKIANGNKPTKKVQEAFEKEFGILKRLASFDHIMHGFGLLKVDNKIIGMMLEAMKGSLSSHLHSNPALSEYARILLVLHCVIGLANMHKAGILHRDIKDANMLVGFKGDYACVGDVGTAVGSVLPQNNFIDDYLATTYTYAHLLLIQAAFSKEKPQKFEYNAQTELFAVFKGILYKAIMSGHSPSIAHKVQLPKEPEIVQEELKPGHSPSVAQVQLPKEPNTVQKELKPYVDNWNAAQNEDSVNVNKSGFPHLAKIYNKFEANGYPDMDSLAQDLALELSRCPQPGSRLLPTAQSS